MTDPHACFYIGFFTAVGIAMVVASLFGWLFIGITEGSWTRAAGRVIAGWRKR